MRQPKIRLIRVDLLDEPAIVARVEISDSRMQELIESIRDSGLINPIAVFAVNGRYQVCAGHRRSIAVKALGWEEVQCKDYTDTGIDPEQIKIQENMHQEPMTDGEWITFLVELREKHEYDLERMKKLTGKSENWIAERMAIYRGSQDVYMALLRGELKLAQAKELNRFPPDWIRNYLQHALESGAPAKVIAKWRGDFELMNLPKEMPADSPAIVEATALPGIAGPDPCALCKEAHSPWTMVPVLVHRGCLDTVLRALKGES